MQENTEILLNNYDSVFQKVDQSGEQDQILDLPFWYVNNEEISRKVEGSSLFIGWT